MTNILNKVLWAPNLTPPIISIHTRAIQHGTNMGENDIGEMFLKFMMRRSLRKSFRVDVTHIWSEDLKLADW